MKQKELICIGCPMGCALVVEWDGKQVVSVTGNTCPRGDVYARKEVTNPTRIVTSSVCVDGGELKMVSVKTNEDIPKDKIFEIMNEIRKTTVKAPIQIGDVILSNVAGTGVDVVATKHVASI
ncbi:MAG: DUF1667 domain-containing protein [Clostridiales bacterium]|nr:DUF1667 domain-containing protein [Clostridiales bacterium]